MTKPAVTIIIATYKAEKYIERCARSLFEQTLEDLEYIFVDDCTPDSSFEVLDRVLNDYPKRREQVRIIRHEKNQGVVQSRTDGMKAATGEFSIHCDPDDWMEQDACEALYRRACETGADIVSGRVCNHFPDKKIVSRAKTQTMSGRDAIKASLFNFPLWLQIIRTSLIRDNELYPWPGIGYAEDSPVVIRAFALAKMVSGIDKVTYHYDRTNESSLTKLDFSQKVRTLDIVFEMLEDWFSRRKIISDVEMSRVIMTYKKAVKSDLLRRDSRDLKSWYRYWPETVNQQIANMGGICKLAFKAGKYLPAVLEVYLRYIEHKTANA